MELAAAALSRIAAGADAEAVVAAAMRRERMDAAARATFAPRVLRAAVLRLRLRYVTGSDDPSTWLAALDAGAADDDDAARWPDDARARMVVRRSCPRLVVDALARALGDDDADRFLAACNRPGRRTLRTNTLRADRSALATRLAQEQVTTSPARWSPWALDVHDAGARRANLFGAPAWRAGWFEVQDEASQLAARATGAAPGQVVVDLCAGRGGKTLALAAMMSDRGALFVHDVDERRLATLGTRCTRAGVTCARRGLPPARSADVVLVDAPCTSLGALRRQLDLRYRLDAPALRAHVATQGTLIEEARALLRPGGRLVYATCSVLREENEAHTADDSDGWRWQRLTPHEHDTDGFTIGVLDTRVGQ